MSPVRRPRLTGEFPKPVRQRFQRLERAAKPERRVDHERGQEVVRGDRWPDRRKRHSEGAKDEAPYDTRSGARGVGLVFSSVSRPSPSSACCSAPAYTHRAASPIRNLKSEIRDLKSAV